MSSVRLNILSEPTHILCLLVGDLLSFYLFIVLDNVSSERDYLTYILLKKGIVNWLRLLGSIVCIRLFILRTIEDPSVNKVEQLRKLDLPLIMLFTRISISKNRQPSDNCLYLQAELLSHFCVNGFIHCAFESRNLSKRQFSA